MPVSMNGNGNTVSGGWRVKLRQNFRQIQEVIDRLSPHYIVGVPVLKSNIRKAQESCLVKTLERRESVLIRGTYRIGKTSMLNSLMERLRRTGAVMIDCQGIERKGCEDLGAFKEVLAYMINERDNSLGGVRVSSDDPLGELAQKCDAPFLALDEVVLLSPEVLQYVSQSITKHKNLKAALVVHAGIEGDAIVRNHFPLLEAQFITAVSREETEKLVLDPLGDQSAILAPLVDKIYELTGGIPILVNALASQMVEIIVNESEAAAAREIEDLFSLGRGYHNFQRSCEIFLSSLAVRCLRDEEKKLLAAIATGQSLREELRGRLDYLAQIGLIKRSPDRINGKILKETYKQLSKELA